MPSSVVNLFGLFQEVFGRFDILISICLTRNTFYIYDCFIVWLKPFLKGFGRTVFPTKLNKWTTPNLLG